ncbi:MAG: Flp family type IVb pilin [Anaerolineae bacterium]
MLWTVMPYVLRAMDLVRKPFRRQEGQGLVEYALILVLVALVIIAALVLLGGRLGNIFGVINTQLDPTNVALTATAAAS